MVRCWQVLFWASPPVAKIRAQLQFRWLTNNPLGKIATRIRDFQEKKMKISITINLQCLNSVTRKIKAPKFVYVILVPKGKLRNNLQHYLEGQQSYILLYILTPWGFNIYLMFWLA